MFDPWFAQPESLWMLLAVPAMALLVRFASLRRRRTLEQLGNPSRSGWRWRPWCLLLGVTLLILACAQPHWGRDLTPPQRVGQDVVLVLDLSRSMSAEQPSRRELAVRALRNVADTFEQDGGHRVALVVFAARPRLLFPLTQDYEHLRQTLAQIDGDDMPALADPAAVSGTRFGAALKIAVEACAPARMNRPLIVLLSDGDDPGQQDEEWLAGVTAAKQHHLRICTVGVGDPVAAYTIPDGKERFEYEGKPVRTRLNEELLRAIAERTGGVYLAAQTHALPLGVYLQRLLDTSVSRDEETLDAALPVYQPRFAWFVLPALLLFMLTMRINEGSDRWLRKPTMLASERSSALVLSLVALLLVSAAPSTEVEAFLLEGNAAFARQDYEAAEKCYEQAGPRTLDPGLVSFNLGAVYYRQGKYRQAVEAYRRCLADDAAPTGRRAQASFNLGNALLQSAGDDPPTLAQAVLAYRGCLAQPEIATALRADARHNLEVAQLLWLRAKAQQKNPASEGEQNPAPPASDAVEESLQNKTGTQERDTSPRDPRENSTPGPTTMSAKKSERLTRGAIQVLPEQDTVLPLRAEDALRTLDQNAQRIAADRRAQRHPAKSANLSTKDW